MSEPKHRETQGMSLQDSGIVISDPDEVRPSRPIPQKEIDEVNVSHVSLAQAVLRTALQIGFKLRCWHDLIPHGQWLKWCRRNLPNISERSIQVYLRLWDHSDLIEARIKNAAAADLMELPTIREALTWITPKPSQPPKPSNPARKEKRASRPRPVDIEATVDASPSEVSPDSQPVRPERMEDARPLGGPEAKLLAALCPSCRALLEEKSEWLQRFTRNALQNGRSDVAENNDDDLRDDSSAAQSMEASK
jgi:hypothetical protein